MLPNGLRSITFGDFRFYPQENALFQNGKSISLTPKMADTLVVLLENPGRIVNKNDLLQAVWPDSFVEEGNLTVTIRQLRKALGDDARDSRYIETVPKRGYRFISEVTEVNAKGAETISEQPISAKSPIRPSSVKRVALAIAAIAIISLFTVLILKRLNAALVQSEFPVLVNSFNTEKVSASGRTLLASISQDGKMVVYTNEVSDKTGVWVRQINSDGNNVEVVPAADFVYGGVAMSPDDNFIYFARRPTEVAGPFDIYRLSILGGTAKKIASQTEGRYR